MLKKLVFKTRKKTKIFLFSLFLTSYFLINYHYSLNNFKIPDTSLRVEVEKKSAIESSKITTTKQPTTTISQIISLKKKKRFFAADASDAGFSSTSLERCEDNIEIEIRSINHNEKNDFIYSLDTAPSTKLERDKYVMVFAMESEPHSMGGYTWLNADFRMWYNLDLSFPAPATYFDVRSFLPDLLSTQKITFK